MKAEKVENDQPHKLIMSQEKQGYRKEGSLDRPLKFIINYL